MNNDELSGKQLRYLMMSPEDKFKREKLKVLGYKILSGTLGAVILGGSILGYVNNKKAQDEYLALEQNYNTIIEQKNTLEESLVAQQNLLELKDLSYSSLEDQIRFLEENTLAIGGAARGYFEQIRNGEITYEDFERITDFASLGLEYELEEKIREHNLTKHELIFDWMQYPVVSPEQSYVSAPYGWGDLQGLRRYHNGSDIVSPYNKNITSVGEGRVIVVNYEQHYPQEIYGETAVIEHYDNMRNPRETVRVLYAHMEKTHLLRGDIVEPGEIIGIIGNTGRSTGPHIHLEMYLQNAQGQWRATNPFSTDTHGRVY